MHFTYNQIKKFLLKVHNSVQKKDSYKKKIYCVHKAHLLFYRQGLE